MSELAPQRTLLPILMVVKAPITVPLKPQLLPISIVASSVKVDIMQGLSIPIRLELGRDKNSQPEPILIEDLGNLLKCVLPSKLLCAPNFTPHHIADNRFLFPKRTCNFLMTTSVVCDKFLNFILTCSKKVTL